MGKYIRLITFLGKAKKETAVKTTISLAVVALSFTQAFFLAQGVSAVFAQEELQTVFTWFLLCLAALLARAWILRFQEGYTKKMAAKVKSVIRDVMLEKLMELGPSYRNERRSGNLQSLITDGVESFEAFLTQYLPQILVVLATTGFFHSLPLVFRSCRRTAGFGFDNPVHCNSTSFYARCLTGDD